MGISLPVKVRTDKREVSSRFLFGKGYVGDFSPNAKILFFLCTGYYVRLFGKFFACYKGSVFFVTGVGWHGGAFGLPDKKNHEAFTGGK